MTDAQVIEALGVEHLSVITSVSQSAVRNWKVRGIPWKHRVKIHEMAKRRKLRVSDGFLSRGNG